MSSPAQLDAAFRHKLGIPESSLDFESLDQQLQAWGNHRQLYKSTCAGTGKSIISAYSPESGIPAFSTAHWWSDDWDQYATGREINWNRPFFPQWQELHQIAPRPSLLNMPQYDENADYTNHACKNKDCYLIFDSDENRDCLYSYSINNCTNVLDSFRLDRCELCYECIDCHHCYDSKFLQNCHNCNHSWFLKNCIGCADCFGCVNLRNKQYYFMNQPCTKKEYEQKLANLELHKFSKLDSMRAHFLAFAQQFPHKAMEGTQNENVRGNYLTNCKNAWYCFDARNLWDCRYITQGFESAKDCMHCWEIGFNAERLYGCATCGFDAQNLRWCSICMDQVSNLDYCVWCWQSSDLFGCVGLRKAQHCILNKSYTAHEYEQLRDKLIAHMKDTGEWGQFFPAQYSPFPYNDSVAQEYYPLTQDEALAQGYWWREDKGDKREKIREKSSNGVPLEKGESKGGFVLPDSITDVPDSITTEILTCAKTSRSYKIQTAELKFYRQLNLPIPRYHHDYRHGERRLLRNPRTLYQRQCADCNKNIWTTYAPNRPEKVVCEECYLKLVD